MKPSEPAIDVDIRQALEASPSALAAFGGLPPSHRREYLSWIGEAKKPETRARRIAATIGRLGGGR